MKKLKKISLQNLVQNEMAKKEQDLLKGGCTCACSCTYECGCKYAGAQEGPNDSYYGGSSTRDNGNANANNLVNSPSNGATSSAGW